MSSLVPFLALDAEALLEVLVIGLFLLLPIVARVLRGLSEVFGKLGDSTKTGRRAGREREAGGSAGPAAELERRGKEAWRRLLEGLEPPTEEPAEPAPPPPPPPRRPRPRPKAQPVPAAAPPRPAEAPRPSGYPRPAGYPRPPEPSLPGGPVEDVPGGFVPGLARMRLESEVTQATLDPLAGEGKGLAGLGVSLPALRTGARRPRRLHRPASWADAVVWSEVLGPPVSMRPPRFGDPTSLGG